MSAKRTFTYDEALASFPTVSRMTTVAVRQVEALLNQVSSRSEMEQRRQDLESAYQQIVDTWTEAVVALGCEVKGLWLVDWDNGAGYYCWQYPEETLSHFHGYEDGFAGRVPIN